LEIIKFLADKLARKIGMSAVAARGLIKLSIKDKYGPFKPYEQLTYGDLEQMIEDSLKKRLEEIEIDNLEDLITFLKTELNENQSLITMGAV
jgi:hypothetical protein